MDTLNHIVSKYKLDLATPSPIEIPVGRDNLSKWLHELNLEIGVELGVAAGEYSENLCQDNPQMKVYGIDPWIPYRGYRDYSKPRTFAKLHQEANTRLAKYPRYKLIREFSLDALKRFADNSLDFVYIDANHQDPFITQDIEGWSQKIRPGGIISGHDYAADVKVAVDKYVLEHKIKPWFLLVSEKPHSWLWIKP